MPYHVFLHLVLVTLLKLFSSIFQYDISSISMCYLTKLKLGRAYGNMTVLNVKNFNYTVTSYIKFPIHLFVVLKLGSVYYSQNQPVSLYLYQLKVYDYCSNVWKIHYCCNICLHVIPLCIFEGIYNLRNLYGLSQGCNWINENKVQILYWSTILFKW